jgi:DNA replication protein DnaC
MSEQYVELARLAEKDKNTYEQYLWQLAELELEYKNKIRVNTLTAQAKFPLDKVLHDYQWEKRIGITQKQAARLSQGEWLKKGANVVFFGGFGMGKTHLSIGLGKALCANGFKVLFFSTHQLIERLMEAKKNLELASLFRRLDRFDLIICDELGYLPQTQEGADLFFQLISQRTERKSLLFTTNLTYSEWDKVFLNPMSTQAAVDRIVHHCETFNISGKKSFRAEEAEKRNQTLTGTESQTTQ